MVVNTQGSRATYTGNGVTTSFSFPNYIKLKSEIKVYLNNVLQTLNTHYTIAGTEPLVSGANIVFSTAPANGVIVKIRRETGLTQSLNLTNSGSFNQEGIEDVLDDVVLKTQEATGKAEDAFDEAVNTVEAAVQDLIDDAEAAAAEAEANADLTAADVITTNNNVTTTTANATAAAAAAAAASNSAGEASAIANGSLNTFTLFPSGTWSPTTSGEARQITGTTTINLPPPVANFWIKYQVIGNVDVTINRNASENFFAKGQTFADDLFTTEPGFYTIACIGGTNWNFTRSNTTDVFVEAPAGADGTDGATALSVSTPVLITSNQDDYSLGGGTFVRLSSDATRNITGIEAGTSGQVVFLVNVGAENIVLVNQSANSAAANRFIFHDNANATMGPNNIVILVYDSTSERWRGARQ